MGYTCNSFRDLSDMSAFFETIVEDTCTESLREEIESLDGLSIVARCGTFVADDTHTDY